jgi:hypothetical protein
MTRLDRTEPELHVVPPGEERDTAILVKALVLAG